MGCIGVIDGELQGYEYFAYLNDQHRTYVSEKVLVRPINCKKVSSMQVASDLSELLLWKKILKK